MAAGVPPPPRRTAEEEEVQRELGCSRDSPAVGTALGFLVSQMLPSAGSTQ